MLPSAMAEPTQEMRCRVAGSILGVRRISRRRKWHPTPVFLPGKSHGLRSLAGYSPRGLTELDTTEWLSTHEQGVGARNV